MSSTEPCWIGCPVCGNNAFREREVKLNSSGMEFLNPACANESATGLICRSCGHVQLFVNRDIAAPGGQVTRPVTGARRGASRRSCETRCAPG